VAKLKEWRDALFLSRTPVEWGEFMYEWIQTFFSGGSKEYLPELTALRLAVAKIVRSAALADENKAVAPEVFISRLKSEYSLSGGKQHFLRDKITFCSLVPLRAVPAKVIAVLGLNDGEFPKTHTPKSFDLLKEIQRNDPNSANDGRYLFLEALMAAKEYLILSYVGFDDGQELAPAIPMVAVETLLKNGFGIKKEIIPLKSVEFEPLQEILRKREKAPVLSNTDKLPPLPLPDVMSLSTLSGMLTQNCEAFFKLRCGFSHDAAQKNQLLTDDPESLSALDNASLATVAPGIAEALVATAIGLFAAIPAVAAYNRFANDFERLSIRFESFAEEFQNILQRQRG
jgi:exonuclease V gamma subunit